MRQWIFLWRNNISGITLDIRLCASLFLLMKIKCIIIPSEKNQALTSFYKKTEVPHYFLRKKSFFSEGIMMHIYFFWRKKLYQAQWSSRPECLMISSEKNEVLHYFFKKNQPFFKDIVRHLILFWRNNECCNFSEEIMQGLILFWRNNEALHFFCRNNRASWLVTSMTLPLLFLQ